MRDLGLLQALVLTDYQGLVQKELAERLGLPISREKSRVQRAREKFKQQLLECCHFDLERSFLDASFL